MLAIVNNCQQLPTYRRLPKVWTIIKVALIKERNHFEWKNEIIDVKVGRISANDGLGVRVRGES